MKIYLLILVIASFLFSSCNTDKNIPNEYKVGLVYLMQHPAIDQGLEGFNNQLDSIRMQRNVKINVVYENAFGEIKNINSIIGSFKNQKIDILVALTTPCAQVAKRLITDIPIIFVGVTDPIAAGLVSNLSNGEANITGTTSKVENYRTLELATNIFPNIKKIGIIYSSSESNSISIINDLETEIKANELNIELIKNSIINTSDIYRTAITLSRNVDGFYVINDNTVVSGINSLIKVAEENNLPIFASDIESVKKGCLFTFGLNYKDEGIAAAKLVEEILLDKKKPSSTKIYINKKSYLFINKKLNEKYNYDHSLTTGAEIVE